MNITPSFWGSAAMNIATASKATLLSASIRRAVIGLTFFASSIAGAAFGQTWDGGGANASWGTVANWNDDTLPGITADVTFATAFTSGAAVSLGGNRTVNSLTFSNPTAFQLSGDTLTITSGSITTSGTFNRVISSNIDIGSTAAVWHVEGSSSANGSRGIDVKGSITSSSSLTKTGPGTLLLDRSGGMTGLTGDVIVNGGLLAVRFQGDQLKYANSLTVNGASYYGDGHPGNLPATGNISLTNAALQYKNNATRPNAISLSGNNSLSFDNGSTFTGLISGGGAGTTLTLYAGGGQTIKLSNDSNSYSSKTVVSLFHTVEFTSIANAGANSALGAPTGDDATLGGAGWWTLRYVGTAPAGHATDRPFTTTQGRPATIEASGVGPLTLNGTVYINGYEGSAGGTLGGTGVGILNGKVTVANFDLKKTGTGTWILTAPDNSIGRDTLIQGGTLLANNSAGSATGTGNVIVQTGGTLGGTGIVAPGSGKSITINAGGTLRPTAPLPSRARSPTAARSTSAATRRSGSMVPCRRPPAAR